MKSTNDKNDEENKKLNKYYVDHLGFDELKDCQQNKRKFQHIRYLFMC